MPSKKGYGKKIGKLKKNKFGKMKKKSVSSKRR